MSINAIETRYAGCRFRSRLEARWAVFFDYLKIPWEYELQGMHVRRRLEGNWGYSSDTFPYLPDFWLPEHNIWGEVKGSLNPNELERLLHAAASLSSNNGGGCHDAAGNDLVIFGPIPTPEPLSKFTSYQQKFPVRLHMHKGELGGSPWPLGDPHGFEHWWLANDVEEINPAAIRLLTGMTCQEASTTEIRPILGAFTAARSARFEHGESP